MTIRFSVFITGASSGIGKTCALHLVRKGIRVFAGIRKPEDGEKLAAESSLIIPVRLDVTCQDEVERAVEEISDHLGDAPLHGLVNNAGIAVAGPVECIPMEALARQLEVNVLGQTRTTQAFLPLLRKSAGRIVFMSSVSGRFSNPFVGAYAASKYAVEALADALRVELAPWNIRVSLIEPGVIATPIWDKSTQAADDMAASLPEEALQLYGTQMNQIREAVKRLTAHATPPERVAYVVEKALLSRWPKARYVVGWDTRLQVWAAMCLPAGVRDACIRFAMSRMKPRETS